MKKIIMLFVGIAALSFNSCIGPEGEQGPTGYSAEAEVFELKNIDFGYNATDGYTIYQTLNPRILSSDTVLIYRMSGLINSTTPIWQLIPRTLYLPQGELDYDYDFSKEDFTIYAGGTYDLGFTPSYVENQTFRIVIVPGYFSKGSQQDYSDYNNVIKNYHIDESKIKQLN